MSSSYKKSALAQADAYEQERKKQAQEAIAQITADAEAKTQAAVDDMDAAVREEQRSLLDTVDTAAVERQVTLGQAKETLARLGLTGSGADAAGRHAAALTETRRVQTARRTRDEAVTALTEALSRREQEIARERDAAVLAETQDAERDAQEQRNDLLQAAYKAEASENAAKIRAHQSAQNAAQSAALSAAKAAASRAESIRQDALKRMLSENQIHMEVYIQAMEEGWSVSETRRQQVAWTEWRKLSNSFAAMYHDQGYSSMIYTMAKHDITERQLENFCFEMMLDIDRVRASLEAAKKEG